MNELIPLKELEESIITLRGQKVMLDAVLARLYQVTTKQLNQQVQRNLSRFPEDFMFQLTENEQLSLRSQIVTLEKGRGKHAKYLPFAFTEQGVAMLSSVLKSERAVQVNIEIMRSFVKLRQFALSHAELAQRLNKLESKYDHQFKMVFDAIRELMSPPVSSKKQKIGF